MISEGRRRGGLVAIFSTVFVIIAAFSYGGPVESLRLHEMGCSNTTVAMITSAWAAGILIGGPLQHWVLSRLGPLRAVAAGLIGSATCFFVSGLFPYPMVWGCLTAVSGMCFGPVWALMEAWINTLARPEARARTTSAYVIVCGLAFSLSPLFLNVVGPEGFLPFGLVAGCIVLSLLPLMALRGLPSPHDDDNHQPLLGVVREFPIIVMLGMVAGFAEQVPMGLLPMFAVEEGHSVAFLTTLMAVIGLGKVVFTVPLGAVADRFSVPITLAVGSLVSAALALGLGLAIGGGWPLYALAFAWGATLDLFYALGLALLGVRFERAQFAAANTVFIMMYAIGGFTGTTGTGAVMDWVGPFGYAATIAVVFAGMGVTLYLNRRSALRESP